MWRTNIYIYIRVYVCNYNNFYIGKTSRSPKIPCDKHVLVIKSSRNW